MIAICRICGWRGDAWHRTCGRDACGLPWLWYLPIAVYDRAFLKRLRIAP